MWYKRRNMARSSHVQTNTIIKEKQIEEMAMRSYYLATMKGVLKTNM